MDRDNLHEINKQYHSIRDMRRALKEMPNYKECFNCQNILPISEFGENNKRYCRPNQKGTNYWCDTCLDNRRKFEDETQ